MLLPDGTRVTIERAQTGSVLVFGTHDHATDVTLCAGASDVTDTNCADGTVFTIFTTTATTDSTGALTYTTTTTTTNLPSATLNTANIWSYVLNAGDISAIGEGMFTLTAIATDSAGTATVSPGYDITVDTIGPIAISAITHVSGSTGNNDIVVTVSEGLVPISVGQSTLDSGGEIGRTLYSPPPSTPSTGR